MSSDRCWGSQIYRVQGMIALAVVILGARATGQQIQQQFDYAQDRYGNCGARCLYLIDSISSEDCRPIHELVQAFPQLGEQKISLLDLSIIAGKMGYESQLLRFDPDAELPDFPYLISRLKEREHFVLLTQSSKGGWVFCDYPAAPRLLTNSFRSSLSGEALAIGVPPSDRRAIAITLLAGALVITVASTIIGGIRRRAATLGIFGLVLIPISSGCSPAPDSPSQRLWTVKPDRLRFAEEKFELGRVRLSRDPIAVETHLLGSSQLSPTISTSCGCASTELRACDIDIGGWPVVFKIRVDDVGSTIIKVTASDGGRDASTSVSYLVTEPIAVSLEEATFQLDKSTGLYAGDLIVEANPLGIAPQIALNVSPEQESAGVGCLPKKLSDSRYKLQIFSGDIVGYQRAFFSLHDDDGRMIHRNLRVQWGKICSIRCSTKRVVFNGDSKSSFLLHSNDPIPDIEAVDCDLGDVQWETDPIHPELHRFIAILIGARDDRSADGEIRIVFTDGDRLTLKAAFR